MDKTYSDNRKKLAEKIKGESPRIAMQVVSPVVVTEAKEIESHVNFWLPSSVMESIKILSIKQKKTIKEIGKEAFLDFIEKSKS